jgi:hypothetical protein
MAKNWKSLTTDEKVDVLRDEVLKIMDTVNLWTKGQESLGAHHYDLTKKHLATSGLVDEVAKAVKALEKKVAKLEK